MMRTNGRKHGEVFTKIEVVQYLLEEVNYSPNNNLFKTSILEPACGSGSFAIEIIKRLSQSSKKYGFDFFKALHKNVRLIELDKENFKKLKENIEIEIYNLGYSPKMIDDEIIINSDYLKLDLTMSFDCIVGNPPYIRYDNLDSETKTYIKKNYSTFKYRADLYIPFYEKSLKLLAPLGKLSFICSNRWLNNQYGKLLREKIADEFHLIKLLNIEKTSPFDEEVIAYPCITTIANKKGKTTLYYETNLKKINFDTIIFNKISSPTNASWQNLFLTYDINHNSLSEISEQGFTLGIGVATGADKIFIKKKTEVSVIEKSRLLPIIKSNALKEDKIKWDESYLINPYENGELCILENFPNLKKYLNNNKNVLSRRYIAKKTPTKWYKTIDNIKTDLVKQNKLLLPDLAGCKFLFIDEGNFYPHHNVYYITNHKINDLKILASILMSDFIKNQLSQIGIRMNGGLPRFQIQSLKKLRIPDFDKLTKIEKNDLITAYDRKDLGIINKVINGYCTNQHIQIH